VAKALDPPTLSAGSALGGLETGNVKPVLCHIFPDMKLDGLVWRGSPYR